MSPAEIDLAQFDLILPAYNHLSHYGINVNPSGNVSLTGNLRGEVCWDKVVFLVHKQDDVIALKEYTDEPRYFTVPKSKSIAAKDLVECLLKKGVSLPAHYSVSWDDGSKLWVGILQKAPAKTRISSGKRSGKKMPKLQNLV